MHKVCLIINPVGNLLSQRPSFFELYAKEVSSSCYLLNTIFDQANLILGYYLILLKCTNELLLNVISLH